MTGRLTKRDEGAVYVEYLFAFPVIFLLFLGMIQLSWLYMADIAVEHAANRAARAAIVVLDDDPQHYGDAPRNDVMSGGSGGLGAAGFGVSAGGGDKMSGVLDALGVRGGGVPGGLRVSGPGTGNARYQEIRSAAQVPLLGLSPSMQSLVEDESLYRAVGGNPDDRALTGASLYNRFAVAVTFPREPGSSSLQTTFDEDDEITVRVTYLVHCPVPLANEVMCDEFADLAGAGVSSGAARRLLTGGGAGRLLGRFGTSGGGIADLQHAEAPHLGMATLGSGAKFWLLQSEATLPNQGANYEYEDD